MKPQLNKSLQPTPGVALLVIQPVIPSAPGLKLWTETLRIFKCLIDEMKRSILLLFAAGCLLAAGCSTTQSSYNSNYEYKIVRSYIDSDLESQINNMAKEGWRVVSSVEKPAKEVDGSKILVILERRKEQQ